MSLKLGDEFPNFALKTTAGDFQLHDWLGERLVIFFILIELNI
jgi:peroxiredoxin